MTNPNREYNKELILVHQFLKEQYTRYLHSNKLKHEKERLQYAHAVETTRHIAYNTNITDKPTLPQQNK